MEQYAGFWIRVGAYIIDAIILAVVGAIIGTVMGVGALGMSVDPADQLGAGYIGYNIVSIFIAVAYFAGMESSASQATIGKKVLGLVVTDASGSRISFMRGVGRYFAKILSAMILLIGFIMVAFTERKQGLHDMVAGTLVLKGEPGMVGTDRSVFE